MNRTELIAATASATGITKTQAEAAVNGALQVISDAMAAGATVSLVGFGTFKPVHRAARTGRLPGTGAAINIPAKNSVKFTPGKALKSDVN